LSAIKIYRYGTRGTNLHTKDQEEDEQFREGVISYLQRH